MLDYSHDIIICVLLLPYQQFIFNTIVIINIGITLHPYSAIYLLNIALFSPLLGDGQIVYRDIIRACFSDGKLPAWAEQSL